jgi:hypothetical protein
MYRVSVTRPNSNGETPSQCWLSQKNTEKMEIPPLRGKGNTKEMRKQKKTRHATRKKSKKQY